MKFILISSYSGSLGPCLIQGTRDNLSLDPRARGLTETGNFAAFDVKRNFPPLESRVSRYFPI